MATKQTTVLSQDERVEFAKALNKQNLSHLDETLNDIQCVDTSNAIKNSDLPSAIPLRIRKQILELSKQMQRAEKDLEDIFVNLEDVAYEVFDERREAEEAKKPKCEACGQTLKRKVVMKVVNGKRVK